jgi:hypothetical protein
MSLPSIPKVAKKLHIDLSGRVSRKGQEVLLVGAMRIDLKKGLALLHKKAHEAQKNGGRADWQVDPKSEIGRQLTRIHAGDELRRLASKHFCHGLKLSFFNCCKGIVGTKPASPMLVQIQCQIGPIAYADC